MDNKINKNGFSGHAQSGFALLNVALALVVAGLMMSGFLALARPIDRETRTEETIDNMQHVIYAVSQFVQRNQRLPCPADPDASSTSEPFGAEIGSGSSGTNTGDCTSDLIGIVPFKTLGIPEDVAHDQWGNFLTYKISSALAPPDPTDFDSPSTEPDVHEQCREKDLWVAPAGSTAVDQNLDPFKAVFCCPAPDAGFDVQNIDGDTLAYDQDENPLSAPGGVYQKLHTPKPPTSMSTTKVPDILAMVLVSHGPNGFGAYQEDGTKMNIANASSFSADEQSNANGSGTYVYRHRTDSDTDYFDDIVMWRSQKMLITELSGNRGSAIDCSQPDPGNGGGKGKDKAP